MHPLSEPELRVLGALVEKQIATPDYYPLSLNALVNACNQKNQREPAVDYPESEVARALDRLRQRQLAFALESAAARVPKYGHIFAKALELDPAETALLCVLILRGPQTPGELRSRTAYLHNFENLALVEDSLQKLASRPEPLVVKLARAPGAREARYAHQLGGSVTTAAAAETPNATSAQPEPASLAPADDDRLAKLEAEVAALRAELRALQEKLGG